MDQAMLDGLEKQKHSEQNDEKRNPSTLHAKIPWLREALQIPSGYLPGFKWHMLKEGTIYDQRPGASHCHIG